MQNTNQWSVVLLELIDSLEAYSDQFADSSGAVSDPPERIDDGHYLKQAIIGVEQCLGRGLPLQIRPAWHRLTHCSRQSYGTRDEIRNAMVVAMECVHTLQMWAAAEYEKSGRLIVDVQRSRVLLDGAEFDVAPHHAEILAALLAAKQSGDWWVTGPQMRKLCGCRGKNLPREIKRLKASVPALECWISSGGTNGYRLAR